MKHKFTTLIAEDDEISFELYKARLQNFNLNIIHAPNGKVAVEKVKENNKIDLILMDIRMPILDGYEATKQIREINRQVPIIAQTAFAAIPEHQKILEMGFTDFFEKPLDETILGTIIDKYRTKN
ncbi:MAG: response regulator [Bacteroidales bacterium]|nr:response regulator [Bacteroidales bacterium]